MKTCLKCGKRPQETIVLPIGTFPGEHKQYPILYHRDDCDIVTCDCGYVTFWLNLDSPFSEKTSRAFFEWHKSTEYGLMLPLYEDKFASATILI